MPIIVIAIFFPFFEGLVNMKDITRDIIQRTIPMSAASLEAIIDIVEYVEYQKNEIFITEGNRNSKEYFVLEGVCRSFLLNPEGEEITISFFTDNSVLSPFTTRTYNGLSNMNFQALTPLKLGLMDAGSF